MTRPGRRAVAAVVVAALAFAWLVYPDIWAALLGLAVAFVVGFSGSAWWVRRKLSPEEAEKDRLARAALRLCRRLPSPTFLHDDANGRTVSVETLWAGVVIGVADHRDIDLDSPDPVRPDATVTWYIVTRWREDASRVLRHVAPLGQPFGLLSPGDVDELLRLDRETGALGADIREIRTLIEVLKAPRRPA